MELYYNIVTDILAPFNDEDIYKESESNEGLTTWGLLFLVGVVLNESSPLSEVIQSLQLQEDETETMYQLCILAMSRGSLLTGSIPEDSLGTRYTTI